MAQIRRVALVVAAVAAVLGAAYFGPHFLPESLAQGQYVAYDIISNEPND